MVGEITTSNLLVILNKTDMIPEASRVEKVDKMKKRLANTFKATKFKAGGRASIHTTLKGALTRLVLSR